ncbi:hypothetical protein AKJ16_DCAP05524 [Drosera capensis]
MLRAFSSSSLTKHSNEEEFEDFLVTRNGHSHGVDGSNNDDEIVEKVKCMNIGSQSSKRDRDSSKRGDEISLEQYGLWRQEQKTRAARLEKQLKARWALEELIDEQLNRFHSHYNEAMVPTWLKDVAQLLMPKCAPPLEMASLGWMGDWRPTSILELLRSLSRCSPSPLLASSTDPAEIDRLLSQLIREIRAEEAVLDEEMAEIQATCIVYLPFSPFNRTGGPALARIQSEFKKIERVIIKAQQLRFRALEFIVKKVLDQADAAEFLVAFTGIQDRIHEFAVQRRFQKGPVSLPTKTLGTA